MEIKDDRKGTQQSRLYILIGGKDRTMSGWGRVPNGVSYAYWACRPKDADTVEEWVASRFDIHPIFCRTEPPQGTADDHCHIYCVESTHPALQGG